MPRTIHISSGERWDQIAETFLPPIEGDIMIEHSLYSIAKWEEKYQRIFLSKKDGPKTSEEFIYYVKCMTISPDVNEELYDYIDANALNDIFSYMNANLTATRIAHEEPASHSRGEEVSSELVYYWMSALQVSFEAQYWHFSRLMALIQIGSEKNKPPKKMSRKQTVNKYAALNEARRRKFGTSG